MKEKKNIHGNILKIIFGVFGISVLIFIVLMWFFLIRYEFFTPDRWIEEVGTMKSLSVSPAKFDVTLPSIDAYGYKYIYLDTSDVANDLMSLVIRISVINNNEGAIHVNAQDYFVGKLDSDEEAIIFDGEIEELQSYYYTMQPIGLGVSYTKGNNRIQILISSERDVRLSNQIRLYAYADPDISL